MERSTMYGCHFIDQPLSSFIFRIDPPELPTHTRWWIQQTSSVGGRDFLPKLWGCFKFSSFTELVQRLMTCWLLFRPFEGRVGLFLCGRTYVEVPLTCRICQYGMSPGFSLCTKPPFLACITAFCFPNFLGVRVRH